MGFRQPGTEFYNIELRRRIRNVGGLPLLRRYCNPRLDVWERRSFTFFTTTTWSVGSIMMSCPGIEREIVGHGLNAVNSSTFNLKLVDFL